MTEQPSPMPTTLAGREIVVIDPASGWFGQRGVIKQKLRADARFTVPTYLVDFGGIRSRLTSRQIAVDTLRCETCGSEVGVRVYGTDHTPLCAQHMPEAARLAAAEESAIGLLAQLVAAPWSGCGTDEDSGGWCCHHCGARGPEEDAGPPVHDAACPVAAARALLAANGEGGPGL